MHNERCTPGSGAGVVESTAGNRGMAPRPHAHRPTPLGGLSCPSFVTPRRPDLAPPARSTCRRSPRHSCTTVRHQRSSTSCPRPASGAPSVAAPATPTVPTVDPTPTPAPSRRPRATSWIPWSELLRRTFSEDLLRCPRCLGATMIIIAFITDTEIIDKILPHLGISHDSADPAPSRFAEQLCLDLDPEGQVPAPASRQHPRHYAPSRDPPG